MKVQIMRSLSLLTVALVTAIPVLASTQPDKVQSGNACAFACRKDGTAGGRFIKLSDDQLEKLHALRQQYLSTDEPKKAELGILRTQEFDLLSQPTVDKQALLALQAKINTLKADLANSRVSFMADASSVFTLEQRQSMRHRMLEREFRGGSRHEHGRPDFGRQRFSEGRREHGRRPSVDVLPPVPGAASTK
jgi:Spy/CpxP family protein refolding chaperone